MHTSQLDQSRQARARKTKAQLWNELKITSITRVLTLVYTVSLLTLLTRIQLNLLGRLNYLSSVLTLSQASTADPRPDSISLENHEDSITNPSVTFGNDFETNRRFLTFSWFLLQKGYKDMVSEVRTAVEQVFGSIPPTEMISQQRLSDLILEVRRIIEGRTEQERYSKRWLRYLLPDRKDEAQLLEESGVLTPLSSSPKEAPEQSRAQLLAADLSSGPLRRLLDECADLIDNITFTRLHTQILDTLFSHLIDKRMISHLYPQPQTTSPPPSEVGSSLTGPRIVELDSSVTIVPTEPQVKLANVLAQFTRQAHILANHADPPNEYLGVIEQEVKELDSFAVVIYTSNLREEAERSMVTKDLMSSEPHGTSLQARIAEMEDSVQSQFEGAWEKVAGSSGISAHDER
ncbi:hypothetical protein BT93_L4388 [Corymbia citriodora subsp. variegata]|uniref:Peroxin-3 n=1 Tax=Corymbia citriodora subsp. variegata TaxID=360336 RepID=A0A8T0CKW9_CORYI|nr:hypothetical protein BT93_L4388 [Corymbia citriodora subsp. variegata]